MKKKGFTLVELIVSFTLVSTIVIILFQLIFAVKELYVSGDIKTMLLNKQGIMTRKIYEELSDKDLISINSCGISCLTFRYGDGSETNLVLDIAANTITFGNYTMKLSDGSKIGNVEFDTGEKSTEVGSIITTSNRVFKIAIPITSSLIPDEDFGIYIIQNYKSNAVSISKDLTIDKAIIMASGVPLKVEKTVVPVKIDFSIDKASTTGHYAKIFNKNKDFSNDEFLMKYDSSDVSNFSALKSINVFKSISRKDEALQIIEDRNSVSSENSNQTIIDDAKEHLQDGYYELVYSENNNLITGDVNHFIQGNDITKKVKISEFIAIDLSIDNDNFIGLNYANFMNNSKSNKQLWIRVDDYISKYGFTKLENIK